jgi:hypothetical protein
VYVQRTNSHYSAVKLTGKGRVQAHKPAHSVVYQAAERDFDLPVQVKGYHHLD